MNSANVKGDGNELPNWQNSEATGDQLFLSPAEAAARRGGGTAHRRRLDERWMRKEGSKEGEVTR